MTTVMCYICWTNLLNTQGKTKYYRKSRSNVVETSLINVKVQIQAFFDDYPINNYAKKCLLLSCTSFDWLMDKNTPLSKNWIIFAESFCVENPGFHSAYLHRCDACHVFYHVWHHLYIVLSRYQIGREALLYNTVIGLQPFY